MDIVYTAAWHNNIIIELIYLSHLQPTSDLPSCPTLLPTTP